MMRGLFGSMLDKDVFRDEAVLYPEFLPEVLPHREDEIHAVADCLKPLMKKSRPLPVFMHGPPGVGKTAVARFILKEIKEDGISGVYVNCWQHNSRHAILTQVSYGLGAFAPRRGTSTDEIYGKFLEGLKKTSRGVVIVLDEIDRILSEESSSVLYDILRNPENQFVGVILISNDPYVLRKVDDRTRSSLNCEEVEFASYTPKELEDILRERAAIAFLPGAVGSGVLPALAHFAHANGGDVRIGIENLLRAGRLAENTGTGKLTMAEVKKVVSRAPASRFGEKLKSLDPPNKQLLLLVGDAEGILSGQLLKKLNSTSPVAPRTFRKYVSELERLGLIKTKVTGKGQKGKSRIISLAFDAKLLEELK